MSKNTRFTTTFRFKIAARLAIVLLCVSSSLVFTDISWAKKPTRKEIRNLIEKLDTNDEIERDKTIGELEKIGKDAVPFLVKAALEDESLLVRSGAKEIFESSQEIPDKLITALESTNVKVRRRAIKWLSEIDFNFSFKSALKIVPKAIE
ncbi:MAG: hypothetical protein AAGM40_30195, partial [Cyanobacteria bacterium J06573_2]